MFGDMRDLGLGQAGMPAHGRVVVVRAGVDGTVQAEVAGQIGGVLVAPEGDCSTFMLGKSKTSSRAVTSGVIRPRFSAAMVRSRAVLHGGQQLLARCLDSFAELSVLAVPRPGWPSRFPVI